MTRLTTSNEPQEAEVPQKVTEHKAREALLYPFKVIVSPFRAFKEIVQNPNLKGLLLIVGLILLTTAGAYYAESSKVFLSVSERPPLSPKLYTYSDAYVYVTAFGNYTFQSGQPYVMNFTFIDKTPLIEKSVFLVSASEAVTLIEPAVTVANDTFYQTTAKLNQSAVEVGNLTLTIQFFSDARPKISTLLTKTAQSDLGDFTINWFTRSPYTYVANGSTAIDLASKTTLSFLESNISRVELGNTPSTNNWARSLLIDWSDYGNATVYGGHDTPFFLGSGPWLEVVFSVNGTSTESTTVGLTYSSLLATNSFTNNLPSLLLETALAFVLNWSIYAAILLLTMRIFGEKRGTWLSFIVVVGYAFSVTIVQWAVGALLFAALPEVHLQVTSWPPARQDQATVTLNLGETWGTTAAYKALTYITFPFINIIDIWLLMLSAIAVRNFSETTWRKATMIAISAFTLRLLLRSFLGI